MCVVAFAEHPDWIRRAGAFHEVADGFNDNLTTEARPLEFAPFPLLLSSYSCPSGCKQGVSHD